jgi:HlyD family secretion protein
MVEIDVGPLQPARALRILVHEGDAVQAGDTLAVFATPTLAAPGGAGIGSARVGSAKSARGLRVPSGRNRFVPSRSCALPSRRRTHRRRFGQTDSAEARGDISRAQL